MSDPSSYMYYSEKAAEERGFSTYKFPNGDIASVTHVFKSKEKAEKSEAYEDLIFMGTSGKYLKNSYKLQDSDAVARRNNAYVRTVITPKSN